MSTFLGIDGGGTKTLAVLLDERGRELGRGVGGPCNIATLSDDAIAASVTTACAAARAAAGLPPDTPVESACAGVAGYTAKGKRAVFAAALPGLVRSARTRVESDFTIAYWGATEGRPGIIVSAGTGAVVFGRNAEGRACRTDGRGFIMGDLGSAYWMGAQAAATTLEWLHGCAPESGLTRAVAEHCAATDGPDLVQWVYSEIKPARMAELAPLVGAHAEMGDQHAVRIVTEAAGHLAASAARCAASLGIEPGGCEVYLLGGLWHTGQMLRTRFLEDLDRRAGGSWPLGEPHREPAVGAALLAMDG